ncbi:MAG: outer membrane protein assembly factor BamB family protein, partial [Planctomycetota bacterium]
MGQQGLYDLRRCERSEGNPCRSRRRSGPDTLEEGIRPDTIQDEQIEQLRYRYACAGVRSCLCDFGPTTSRHGPGVSPIAVDDLVVFSREQGAKSDSVPSEWVALDRRTGQTRWTTPRKAGAISYSTPCLYSSQGGPARLIFTSQLHGITAVNPKDGKVVWDADFAFIARVASSPVIVGDLIAGTCGQGGGGKRLAAIRP